MLNSQKVIEKAREVLSIEMEGIASVREQLGDDFVRLAEKCMEVLDRNGKIVVCGVGKSGHIGRKISASLASTGSPSIFMHPVEAMHGDLGMLQENDLLLSHLITAEEPECEGLPVLQESCSVAPDGTVQITLVNPALDKSRELTVETQGMTPGSAQGRILTGMMDDHNTFDKPGTVADRAFTGFALSGTGLDVTVPPCSVVHLAVRP